MWDNGCIQVLSILENNSNLSSIIAVVVMPISKTMSRFDEKHLTGHQKRVVHVADVVILFMSEDDEQV